MQNHSNMRHTVYKPTVSEIEYKSMRFLITDRPSDQNIQGYIKIWSACQSGSGSLPDSPHDLQELKKYNVRDVVRVCEPTYKVEELKNEGINVIDLEYEDGTPPPQEVVAEWFKLLKARFRETPGSCVAVHCVAGLGRAPVLVAVALIELGLEYEDAVELIRRKRRGAINARQLSYLEKYRPRSRLKLKNGLMNSCCLQ